MTGHEPEVGRALDLPDGDDGSFLACKLCGSRIQVVYRTFNAGDFVCEQGHRIGGFCEGGQLDIGIVHDPALLARNEVKIIYEQRISLDSRTIEDDEPTFEIMDEKP